MHRRRENLRTRVNLVTGGGLTWVFKDLVERLQALVKYDVIATDHPLQAADVFHFWRPQLAANVPDLSNAVLTCHGLGYWQEGEPIYNLGVMQAFARARAVIVLNRGDEHTFGHLSSPGNTVHCIPHAVDPEVFTLRPPHNPREKLVIGRVGRPYDRPNDDAEMGVACKGNATLREIMRGLVPHRDVIKWLFLGEGWEQFEAETKDLGFEAEFRRRSEVGYPHGYVLAYHEMDVFLVTSRSEGGPASLPEAMACGVVPVTTPAGMCRDLMGDLWRLWGYNVNRHERAVETLTNLTRRKLQNETQLDGGIDKWREPLRAAVVDYTWSEWAAAHERAYDIVASNR